MVMTREQAEIEAELAMPCETGKWERRKSADAFCCASCNLRPQVIERLLEVTNCNDDCQIAEYVLDVAGMPACKKLYAYCHTHERFLPQNECNCGKTGEN